MNRVGAYGIALALALPPSFLDAQETPILAPGARVRVSIPKSPCSDAAPRCYRKVVGTLTSVDSLNIIVRSAEDSAELSLPLVPGTQLDISRGPGPCFQRRGTCVSLGFLSGAYVLHIRRDVGEIDYITETFEADGWSESSPGGAAED